MQSIIDKLVETVQSWAPFFSDNIDGISEKEKSILKLVGDRENEAGEAMKMSEISNNLGFSKPLVTQIVARLERRKLVNRRHSRMDRRSILVSLTENGRDEYENGYKHMNDTLEKFVTGMGEADTAELIRLLCKARLAVDAILAEKAKENVNA